MRHIYIGKNNKVNLLKNVRGRSVLTRLLGISVCATAIMLAACGGGGGGAPSAMEDLTPPVTVSDFPLPIVASIQGNDNLAGYGERHYSTSDLTIEAADVRHSPIYSNGKFLQVGIDQGRQIGDLPPVGGRDGAVIRYGSLADGVGRQVVANYLAEGVIGSSAKIFLSTPVVRVTGSASQSDIYSLHAAVQLVNAALPEEKKLRMGPTLPYSTLIGRSDGLLDNTIHVDFVAADQYNYAGAAITLTQSNPISSQNPVISIKHSRVLFNKGNTFYGKYADNRLDVIALAHELIHALGAEGHISDQTIDSILKVGGNIYNLNQSSQQPRSILYPADREALRALHGRLDVGDSLNSFGAWANTSLHIVGNTQYANFGVAMRNGYAEPWGYGIRPESDLSGNQSLSGSVTWQGTLVGLTTNSAAVVGDAKIDVNLSTLTGRADFTNLEIWAVNTAPGAAGSGTQWLDGDLGYTITVRGNTFRQNGGDSGRLTGIFTGRQHEGATGTLDRSDLTAAFGASRQ